MQNVTMVIARFNESLSWLDFMPKNINFLIYNKGQELKDEKLISQPNIKIIEKCHNTGRETETYLRHIVSNYDNLSDIVIFTQGNPLEHNPNFSHLAYGIANGEMNQDCMPMSIRWNNELPPQLVLNQSKTPYFIETASRYTLCPIKHWDLGIHHTHENYCHAHELQPGTDVFHHFCNLINFSDMSFGKTETFDFFYSGIFAVKKQAILKHNLNFYFNCHSICNKAEVHGFMFERLWWTIFV